MMQHALVGEQGIFSMGRALADELRRLLMENEADGVRANDLQKNLYSNDRLGTTGQSSAS